MSTELVLDTLEHAIWAGRPGDLSAGRPACVTIHPGCRHINTSTIGVLLRPVEPGQYTSFTFTSRLIEAGMDASVGSVSDAYDNALAESQSSAPTRPS